MCILDWHQAYLLSLSSHHCLMLQPHSAARSFSLTVLVSFFLLLQWLPERNNLERGRTYFMLMVSKIPVHGHLVPLFLGLVRQTIRAEGCGKQRCSLHGSQGTGRSTRKIWRQDVPYNSSNYVTLPNSPLSYEFISGLTDWWFVILMIQSPLIKYHQLGTKPSAHEPSLYTSYPSYSMDIVTL
jgi:hypothetical protein